MRAKILEKFYEWSKTPYQRFLKTNEPWIVSIQELQKYPKASLGFHLSRFLLRNDFEIQAKLEAHDVFHVLTNTGVSVPEEISMQYYLWGNGKRSLYQFSVIALGSILYPDYLKKFIHAYHKGTSALVFHQLDFSKMLYQPLKKIKSTFLIP
ncbi:MAG: hypothetical protein COA50_07320 [Flavobacteriaceae bacterium]|nr:MAG: hypothetical protein COA50_07320 [Flavobacteriaceae bacterium]